MTGIFGGSATKTAEAAAHVGYQRERAEREQAELERAAEIRAAAKAEALVKAGLSRPLSEPSEA